MNDKTTSVPAAVSMDEEVLSILANLTSANRKLFEEKLREETISGKGIDAAIATAIQKLNCENKQIILALVLKLAAQQFQELLACPHPKD